MILKTTFSQTNNIASADDRYDTGDEEGDDDDTADDDYG